MKKKIIITVIIILILGSIASIMYYGHLMSDVPPMGYFPERFEDLD